jgi:glycosyltransferase involved in cell wall biosynthesis
VLGRVPQAHFVWAGTGPLESALRQQAAARGLGGHVHLLGHRTDVGALLAAAGVCVLPSLFEGLPLAVLEAMAAGVPVVGTRVCGTAEAVRDGCTGRLVAPRDPAALAGAILEVLECPALAACWGAAGRRRVRRHFSARRMARATARVYGELIGPPLTHRHTAGHVGAQAAAAR